MQASEMRKSRMRRRFGRRRLLLAGSLLRGFHDIPVYGAVGQFAGVELGRGEDDLGYFEALVAEERKEIDDHRDALGGRDRVALEPPDAHERQPPDLQRRMGQVAQQADVQFLEVETGLQQLVGFVFDDRGDLAPQRHGRHDGDGQQHGDDRGRDADEFLHCEFGFSAAFPLRFTTRKDIRFFVHPAKKATFVTWKSLCANSFSNWPIPATATSALR